MDIRDSWERALKKTEVVRPRVLPLATDAQTRVPYIFLAESSVNRGDTVVRKGEVVVEKPSIVLPFNVPQFEGFDFEKEMQVNEEALKNFFLVRGVSLPSLKYANRTTSLDLFEGGLSKAIEHHTRLLQQSENTTAGLVIGPEDTWLFSVLIFTAGQVARSAPEDFRRLLSRGLLDDLRGPHNLS